MGTDHDLRASLRASLNAIAERLNGADRRGDQIAHILAVFDQRITDIEARIDDLEAALDGRPGEGV